MSDRDERTGRQGFDGRPAAYEPPRVEQVLTPAELEQEIRYAGDVTQDT